jgi:hypothetical protein
MFWTSSTIDNFNNNNHQKKKIVSNNLHRMDDNEPKKSKDTVKNVMLYVKNGLSKIIRCLAIRYILCFQSLVVVVVVVILFVQRRDFHKYRVVIQFLFDVHLCQQEPYFDCRCSCIVFYSGLSFALFFTYYGVGQLACPVAIAYPKSCGHVTNRSKNRLRDRTTGKHASKGCKNIHTTEIDNANGHTSTNKKKIHKIEQKQPMRGAMLFDGSW